MKLDCLIAVQQKKPSAGMPCFLQLGEPAAAQMNKRKKAEIALQKFNQLTCSKAHERCSPNNWTNK